MLNVNIRNKTRVFFCLYDKYFRGENRFTKLACFVKGTAHSGSDPGYP